MSFRRKRNKGGRPRNPDVVREKNGQKSRTVHKAEPPITKELLMRRAEACGMNGDPTDARAGTVLGQLLLRGWITQRQFDGGNALGTAWRRWARMAEVPSRHPRAAALGMVTSTPPDAMPLDPAAPAAGSEEDAWQKTDDALRAWRAAVPKPKLLALSIAESVCVDDVMPPRLHPAWVIGMQALRDALDAAADLFGVPWPQRAA